MTKGAEKSAPLPEDCFFVSFLSFTLVALYDEILSTVYHRNRLRQEQEV